jgi:hypothetical protein
LVWSESHHAKICRSRIRKENARAVRPVAAEAQPDLRGYLSRTRTIPRSCRCSIWITCIMRSPFSKEVYIRLTDDETAR